MKVRDVLDYPYDPWILLGVPRDADDRDVAGAWRRAGSPRSGPLARAYELLRDEESRRRTTLLSPAAYERAEDAGSRLRRRPVYVGPGAWYGAIAQRRLS